MSKQIKDIAIEFSENGADYSETIQLLPKRLGRALTDREERALYALFQSWGLV